MNLGTIVKSSFVLSFIIVSLAAWLKIIHSYLDIGAGAIVYYSISQQYEIMPGGRMYSTNNAKPLEFGANLNLGVLKEYRKFYIRPALVIPVYQNFKGDKVFYEYKNMNIRKWFNGIGLMVRVGKYI